MFVTYLLLPILPDAILVAKCFIYICMCMYIYTIYIYVYIWYIYILYIYISFFSLTGETLKFKIEGRKGLPIFKRNLTRLMSSCCYIKICQHNCFLLIVLILLKMIILNRLENFEIWNRWLTECTNLQESKILLLFWEVIFWFVAQLIFPFVQYIKHSVYVMHKLIVFHQICCGCQVPLNAQIRVVAEIIKSPNVYNNKMQRSNSILPARLVSITKMFSLLSKMIKVSSIVMHWTESALPVERLKPTCSSFGTTRHFCFYVRR